MKTQSIQLKATSYKGYLNLKTCLPRESILYHMGSLFLSLFFFFILFFCGLDAVLAACLSALVAVGSYLSLFKLNNYYFSKDQFLLEQLIVHQKIDVFELLHRFFSDLQHSFERSSLPYMGTCEKQHVQQVDVVPLFRQIFRENAVELIDEFQQQGGNFYLFLRHLKPEHREALYRYYLSKISV